MKVGPWISAKTIAKMVPLASWSAQQRVMSFRIGCPKFESTLVDHPDPIPPLCFLSTNCPIKIKAEMLELKLNKAKEIYYKNLKKKT